MLGTVAVVIRSLFETSG